MDFSGDATNSRVELAICPDAQIVLDRAHTRDRAERHNRHSPSVVSTMAEKRDQNDDGDRHA